MLESDFENKNGTWLNTKIFVELTTGCDRVVSL